MNQLDVYQQMAMDLRILGQPGDMGTTEIINYGYQIDPHNPWFSLKERKLNVPFIMKELIWYMDGNMEAKWIGDHAKVWKSVLEHDGRAVSNYGHETFAKGGLGRAVEILSDEPMSRRAMVYFGNNEYVKHHTVTKDQPCANSIHWMVRDGVLRTIVSQRSQDYIYGVSGDAVFMALITNLVAAALDVEMAPIDVQVASFHHYPRHEEMVRRLVHSDRYHIDWYGHQVSAGEASSLIYSHPVAKYGELMLWITAEAEMDN